MSSQRMPQISAVRTPNKALTGKENIYEVKQNQFKEPCSITPARKKIQLTPKPVEHTEDITKPSPMTKVLSRQKFTAPKKIVSLTGDFTRPKEYVVRTLKNLQYEVTSPVTKDTSFVLRSANGAQPDKLASAATFGIPVIDEDTLFNKPDGESDTESDTASDNELRISDGSDSELADDEVLMVLDDVSEDEQLLGSDDPSVPKHGERLKGKRVAFVGKFETSYAELRNHVLSQGGTLTSVEDLILPASHIVMSHEYGSRREFLQDYSNYWWIRSAVFIDEDKFLNICSGVIECPVPKKRFNVSQSMKKSMKRLSLDDQGMDTICTKRKTRPPSTPKKKGVIKPLFSFGSPERKRGRTEQMENLTTFQFTSTRSTPPSTKPALKFPSKCASTVSTAQCTTSAPVLSLPKSQSLPTVTFMLNERPAAVPILSDKLAGKIVVLMGKFKKGKKDICDLVVAHSGTIPKSSHLSCKISYLVCGVGAEKTQKYQKAKQKGITTITEAEFLDIIA